MRVISAAGKPSWIGNMGRVVSAAPAGRRNARSAAIPNLVIFVSLRVLHLERVDNAQVLRLRVTLYCDCKTGKVKVRANP
jgi:hypothetical protein